SSAFKRLSGAAGPSGTLRRRFLSGVPRHPSKRSHRSHLQMDRKYRRILQPARFRDLGPSLLFEGTTRRADRSFQRRFEELMPQDLAQTILTAEAVSQDEA